jgi:hypothetical protein
LDNFKGAPLKHHKRDGKTKGFWSKNKPQNWPIKDCPQMHHPRYKKESMTRTLK